ncbi:D-arabinono-1,4-lactone oxidase [Streptomyces sp. NPDC058534]|uniref:D-arabinono-1,4-lactone oxidase n=1 Tax=Streptomyces sp. NPDC058534 TaxID=3346541 RepID=UPI003656CB36
MRELDLVPADGSTTTCSATQHRDLFATARVSLGALGVITAVTLQCVPLHALRDLDPAGAAGADPGISRLASRLGGSRDVTDLARRVSASPRSVGRRQGEYAVPRDTLVDALRELGCRVDSHGDGVSFSFGVRFAAADDIWLSPAHERDVVHIAFHQYHRTPHERWFQVCEDVLGAAGGRPHRGRTHRLDAVELAPRSPRFQDVTVLRARLDPSGMFADPAWTASSARPAPSDERAGPSPANTRSLRHHVGPRTPDRGAEPEAEPEGTLLSGSRAAVTVGSRRRPLARSFAGLLTGPVCMPGR